MCNNACYDPPRIFMDAHQIKIEIIHRHNSFITPPLQELALAWSMICPALSPTPQPLTAFFILYWLTMKCLYTLTKQAISLYWKTSIGPRNISDNSQKETIQSIQCTQHWVLPTFNALINPIPWLTLLTFFLQISDSSASTKLFNNSWLSQQIIIEPISLLVVLFKITEK